MASPITRAAQMRAYTSYDGAWGVPIFFPLTVGAVAQAYVYCDYRNRSRSLLVTLTMVNESVFTLVCLVSCTMNVIARTYVGKEPMCYWQGWYSTFYTYASLNLYTLNYLSLDPPLIPAGSLVLVLAGSLLVSLLPFAGVLSFMFARDFCMHDLEQLPFSVVFTSNYVVSVLLLLWGYAKRSRSWADVGTVLYPIASFLPMLIVAAFTLAGDPVMSSGGPLWLYAVMAVCIHSNQIVIPLLFGYYWVREKARTEEAKRSLGRVHATRRWTGELRSF